MLTSQHYTASQRRAVNQVWSAAGSYGFEPLFLALRKDGTPDLYMNCIIGCVHRWYGDETVRALFASWEGDRRQPLLDDLAWLALESAAYGRESPHRPILEAARQAHALDFFAQEQTLSRQEWMAKNQLCHTMQTARWRSVLGRKLPVMTPGEKALYAALTCAGEEEGSALAERVKRAFEQARLFSGTVRGARVLRLHFDGRWAPLLTRFLRSEIVHTDMLTVGASVSSGRGEGQRLDLSRARFRIRENAETDREYIESCFGPSLYPPEQLAAVEQRLCTGKHQDCHLWFTAGTPDAESARGRESKFLAGQAALQCARNQEAFLKDRDLYQNAILRLTEQIRNCIQIHNQTEWERACQGRLDAPRVWRAAALEDGAVFLRDSDTERPGFSVDLLLDGSASRLHCQELIAAQACILAEGLGRCGVPVRITSFCSLRGYTVLRVLKGFSERNTRQNAFRYFASGWNRDGLALRCAGELLNSAPAERRILILLTDANPNDSHRIPLQMEKGVPIRREYEGRAAVEDAAAEVRALRRRDIRVAAVFMGGDQNAANAELIYGRSMARIRRMDQLANAAGRLIQNEIAELPG